LLSFGEKLTLSSPFATSSTLGIYRLALLLDLEVSFYKSSLFALID